MPNYSQVSHHNTKQVNPINNKTMDDAADAPRLFLPALTVPAKLTSRAFSVSNPPTDWCDVALLIPHETIRHEMNGMLAAVQGMTDEGKSSRGAPDAWRLMYFAEWYLDYFCPFIHEHHDNEEEIYFPWIATRAQLPDKFIRE